MQPLPILLEVSGPLTAVWEIFCNAQIFLTLTLVNSELYSFLRKY